MIIRSQNKKRITNIGNCSLIDIIDSCNHTKHITFDGMIIGTYSTEEKAIKVLDIIQNAYTQYGTIKDGLGSIHGVFNIPKCFQMPSDEEIEV